MLTQVELEQQTYAFGRRRAEDMMKNNEDKGRAHSNPYAQAVFRRFILPLAGLIQEDLAVAGPGRRKAYVNLLRPMDPEAVAFIAVRNALITLMSENTDELSGGRKVISAVGKSVYHELLLSMFSHATPELFYKLVNDLDRRMSKSERHRMTVFKMQAQKAGLEFPEWGQSGVEQVGSYLIEKLAELGMVDVSQAFINGRVRIVVALTEDILELLATIKEHIVETTPYFLPCVERPRDWVGLADGGWHTDEMRRISPYLIKSQGFRDKLEAADLTKVYKAVNRLQGVAWQVNGDMLDVIRRVAKHFDMDEIISQAEMPAPDKPDWLFGEIKAEEMSPAQLEEFTHWKRAKAEWHTQMKLRGTKYGRFYTATSVAEKFRTFNSIYFVYFADFRGRLYCQTTGISPQGSDMQKALLRFSSGKPLATEQARRWFCINGANKFGYDKVSLDDRVRWVTERHDLIMAFGEDPVSNTGWQAADKPLQFLAWCLEYRAWKLDPPNFYSHLPIGMDGSCNGLQNFSAMLRDGVGGRATNLVPSALPSDIYQMVADVTKALLEVYDPETFVYSSPEGEIDEEKTAQGRAQRATFKLLWLKHGMNRKLVKRSVMTLPYGSTRFSCADFIVGDYLKQGMAPEFEKAHYQAAAQFLSHFVWEAIGEVVVKAKEAMDWLQSCARALIKYGQQHIEWTVPSGFPVVQTYQKQEVHRINAHLCGNVKLRINRDMKDPDPNRHKNGIAPNFIHSHDACHMTLTICEADDMDLAMIHDDYGTHAADADNLYYIIRKVFVDLYSEYEPLQAFADRYGIKAPPPSKGDLDLMLVMESPYFFS